MAVVKTPTIISNNPVFYSWALYVLVLGREPASRQLPDAWIFEVCVYIYIYIYIYCGPVLKPYCCYRIFEVKRLRVANRTDQQGGQVEMGSEGNERKE